MEIACPRCGLLRTVPDDRSSAVPATFGSRAEPRASTSRSPADPPCPRCAERAALLGESPDAAASGAVDLARRGEWHVVLRGLQRGPYTLTALRKLLADEQDAAEASVWRQGMTNWVSAHELESLAPDTLAPPGAPRASVAPTATTVQRARVYVVSDRPPPVAPVAGADAERGVSAPSRVASAAVAPATAPKTPVSAPHAVAAAPSLPVSAPVSAAAVPSMSLSASLAAAAPSTLASAPPESFSEASRSLRPDAPPRRPASRAAGEITLTIPALRSGGQPEHWRWLVLAGLGALAVGAGWLLRARHKVQPPVLPRPVIASPVNPPRAPAPAPPRPTPVAEASAHPAAPPAPPSPSVPVAVVAPAAVPHVDTAAPDLAAVPAPEHHMRARAPGPAVDSVRVASAWAPIRVASDAEAKVVCSLPRGTELEVLAQRPGQHRGLWFEVRCDHGTRGWVHQNHLHRLRP